MKTYCLSCNFGSEWSNGVKPTFCSKCGKPYVGGQSTASYNQPETIKTNKPAFVFEFTNIKSVPVAYPINNQHSQDEDNIVIPKLDKIECNISSNLRPNRQTAEMIFAEGANNIRQDIIPRVREKAKKITAKQRDEQKRLVAEQFKQDFNRNNKQSRVSQEIE